MKLISMTDFVLEQNDVLKKQSEGHIPTARLQYIRSVSSYVNFLKQPLTLGMFVPCDEGSNVLEEPVNYETCLRLHNSKGSMKGFKEYEQYQQAKERVLFEGFEIIDNILHHNVYSICSIEALNDATIEDLTHPLFCDNEITLTQSALKQIGL